MPFKNKTWPNGGETCLTYETSSCKGHHSYDLTFWESTAMDPDGSYSKRHYSNQETRDMIRPDAYRMPYVYSQFEWPHCSEEGYDFRHIFEETPIDDASR